MINQLAPGSISAAIVVFVSALLDALTLFGAFHVDAAQRTAVLAVVTSALAVAALLIPYFQHQFGMSKLK